MKRFSILAAMTAVAFVCSSVSTRAETFVPLTGPTATPAEWVDVNNWNPNSIPNATDATAIFTTPTAARTVSLASNVTVGTLSFTNNSVFTTSIGANLNGSGSTLTFANSSGTATITESGTGAQVDAIAATMVFNSNVIIDVQNTAGSSAGAFRIGGPINGAGGLTKNGPGVLTVAFTPSQTNLFKDYTGPTVINAGRFRISSGGTPRFTSSATVNSGGQITLASTNSSFTFGSQLATVPNLNLNGTGLSTFPGAIRADQGIAIITNPIVLQSSASIDVPQQTGTNSLALPGGISGPGRLELGTMPGDQTKQGALNFTGPNTYTGGTQVTQGTLVVQSASSLGTGSVMVDGRSLAPGGAVNGIAAGKLTLQTSAAISDTSYLNLTGDEGTDTAIGGMVTLDPGVNEVVGGLMLGGVIFGPGTYGNTASSQSPANVGAADPNAFFLGDGIITVSATACGGFACVPGDYNGNGAVDAADYVLWRKGGPLQNDFTPGVQASDYDFWRSRFGSTTNPGSGSSLANSAVPEPSTIIMLAGFAASTLIVHGRRRVVPNK